MGLWANFNQRVLTQIGPSFCKEDVIGDKGFEFNHTFYFGPV